MPALPVPFNRTIVELKRVRVYDRLRMKTTFNRTIVELKQGYGFTQALILTAFNRTIVELKLLTLRIKGNTSILLIVP